MYNKKAFTLIELLVVVSIIAVLMSIMMPSLQKAREQSKRVVCSNRLKQLGVAFYLYGEDNKGMLPKWRDGNDPTAPGPVNHFLIINSLVELTAAGGGKNLYPNYIEDRHVFYCPNSDYSDLPAKEAFDTGKLTWSPEKAGYDTWSSFYYLGGGNGTFEQLVKSSSGMPTIKSPRYLSDKGTLSPLMMDSWVWLPTAQRGYVNHTAKGASNVSNDAAGCNVLLVDTHVEWYKAADIKGEIRWGTSTYKFVWK